MQEFNKKDNQINIKNKKYQKENEYEDDAATDLIDDTLNALAPPPK